MRTSTTLSENMTYPSLNKRFNQVEMTLLRRNHGGVPSYLTPLQSIHIGLTNTFCSAFMNDTSVSIKALSDINPS